MSLAQQALDLTAGVQTRMANSGEVAGRQNISDIVVAVQLLAQNALSATPVSESLDPGTAIDVPTNEAANPAAEGS